MDFLPLILGLALVLGCIVACFLIPDQWTVTDYDTGDRVAFRAFSEGGAKRKAKRIMRRKGWGQFRLRHMV